MLNIKQNVGLGMLQNLNSVLFTSATGLMKWEKNDTNEGTRK